jgi:endonuclease III
MEDLAQSRLYSEELGIDLASGNDRELFSWLLASMLFGARISEKIAKQTYRAFKNHGLLDPQRIIDAGMDELIQIMHEGGYTRYDGVASDQILRTCRRLVEMYDGSLIRLLTEADGPRDLERQLEEFHGIGPVTVNIFLRELRPFWKNADPEPLPRTKKMAERCGIDLNAYDRSSMTFARVEAGLIRMRRKNPQKE